MGIVDLFNSEDRTSVKFSDFYNLVREATKAEFLLNGIQKGVDHASMYSMATGKTHPDCNVTHSSVHTVEMNIGYDSSNDDESCIKEEK